MSGDHDGNSDDGQQHEHRRCDRPLPADMDPIQCAHARWPPWALKKLTRNVAPPIRKAAANATSTPDLPLPATCGLPECEPMAHAIAEMAIPATEATSPKVSRAPTMDSREAMPGRPVRFGGILTSLTNMLIAPRVQRTG